MTTPADTLSGFDPRRDLRGIVASLHTPFTAGGEVDHAALRRLVDHVAEAGCSGVLATAVAGEVGSLRPDERSRLLATLGETMAGRLVLVAGVSAPELGTSLSLAAEARAVGAAMVMWQPPAGAPEDAIRRGLEALVEAGPGQVMLQDLDWHGTGLPVGAIAALAEAVPGFTALKVETAPAGPKYTAVREAVGDRLHLSGGWAAMQMVEGLARRLDCFIPSALLPAYVRIFDLWTRGEKAAARALFERLLPIIAFSNQHIAVSIPFWKGVRLRQGIFGSDLCRPPITALDPVQSAEATRLGERAASLDAEFLQPD